MSQSFLSRLKLLSPILDNGNMSSSISTISLNDGTRIPWLGFGTGTALYSQNAEKFVTDAINTGITHLDGAQVYQNEDSLGAGIKGSNKPRSELYITTKLVEGSTPETVKSKLKESLQKLGVDYVDLFLIHSPAKQRGNLKNLWKALEEVKAEGLTKSIGVSNFTVKDLNEVLEDAKVVPAVNQIEFHPYVYAAAEPIHKLCQERGIRIASFGGQTPVARASGGPVDSVLERIRSRLQQARGQPVSAGQVLSKWILQKGGIVVTTSSKISRIKEFIDTKGVPDLTAQEIQEIEEAGARLHKRIFMRHVFDE